jgi:hypothetical protein
VPLATKAQWLIWLQGLAASAIHGAALAITLIIVDPTTFNMGEGLGNLAQVMAVSALGNVGHFLLRSPWPDKVKEDKEDE